jgi:HdeA/HdeB family protein
MNANSAAVLLSALLIGCAQAQPPNATAPPAPPPPAASAAAPAASSAPAAAPAASSAPAAAPAASSAPAAKPTPADHIVSIQKARCGDLLKLSPQDRDAASMFYIGYQASRIRATTINVGLIPSIEDQALVYCTEHPDEPLARAFAEAYSHAR